MLLKTRRIFSSRRTTLSSAAGAHQLSGKGVPHKIPELPLAPVNFERLHLEVLENHVRLGTPIYTQSVGDTKIVWISDPAMCESVFRGDAAQPIPVRPQSWLEYNNSHQVRRGLLFQDGHEWETTRSRMNPIFLKNSDFKPHLDTVRSDLMQQLKRNDQDLESTIHQWSVQNVLAALFGRVYLQEREIYSDMISDLIKANDKMMEASTELQKTPVSDARHLNTPDWQNFEASTTKILEISGEISRHLLGQDTECDGGMAGALVKCFEMEKVHSLVSDLVIAAADTTSYSTLWTLYLLAKHPDIQGRARESCLQSIKPSQYVRRAIKESLRLFPVAPFLTRIASKEMRVTSFEGLTFVIGPGSAILMGTYAMGRDPKFFRRPDRFDPERWDRDLRTRHPGSAFAVLPFGFGPRRCIGKQIAEYSMEAFIHGLLSQSELTSNGDVNYVMRLIGVPDKKIPITFKFF